MHKKRTLWLLLIVTLLVLTSFFAFLLKPQTIVQDDGQVVNFNNEAVVNENPVEPENQLDVDEPLETIEPTPVVEKVNVQNSLSSSLQSIKAGKSSVLNLVFSDTDLNQAITDLLALAEAGEPWVNYALGQIVDTCGELHQRSEPELIEMFSGMGGNALPPEQQNTMNQLMPIVLNASKRCRSIDKSLLAGLGDDARSWFRTGAEAGDANAYVNTGFTLLNEELKAQSEEYQNADDDERWKVGKELREQARKEFRDNMRTKLEQGALTPELLVNMSEHLNLFYDGKQDFKQREAWVLLACEMGYENNCNSQSTAVQLMCMFQETCQAGTDYQQGVLWSQGQFKLDEYQQTANELKQIIESKDWDRLGF